MLFGAHENFLIFQSFSNQWVRVQINCGLVSSRWEFRRGQNFLFVPGLLFGIRKKTKKKFCPHGKFRLVGIRAKRNWSSNGCLDNEKIPSAKSFVERWSWRSLLTRDFLSFIQSVSSSWLKKSIASIV